MPNSFRIAIVVGHTKLLPGAHAVAPIGTYEYFYNRQVASFMKGFAAEQGCSATVFLRDDLTVRETYNQVIRANPDCVLELHFNAANGLAQGTETLYGDQNPLSGEYARCVQDLVCKLFQRDVKTNRGIKKLAELDRGYSNVNIAKCPSILVEPFFGDNPQDSQLGFQFQESLARNLIDGTVNFLIGFRGKHESGGFLGKGV